jgi:hypothetical protein
LIAKLWAIADLPVKEGLLGAKAQQGNTSLVGAALRKTAEFAARYPMLMGKSRGPGRISA